MTMTIRYQTKNQSLTQVDSVKEIPETATIVWFDFENATQAENDYLISQFEFNYLELEDAITGVPRVKYKSYETYQYLVKDSFALT